MADQQETGGSAQTAWAALQVVSLYAQSSLQRSLTNDANMLARVNAEATNTVRRGQNALQAAETSYGLWAQSVSNQRRLRVSGKQAEAAQQTLARLQDQRTGAGLARRVQSAEEQGMIAARSAFAGVSGSAADAIAGTAALRDSLVREQAERTGTQQEYEARQRAGGIASDAIQGLDNTAILSNLNMNTAMARQTIQTGSALKDALLSKEGLTLVASMFAKDEKTKQAIQALPMPKTGTVNVGNLETPNWDYSLSTNTPANQRQGLRYQPTAPFTI